MLSQTILCASWFSFCAQASYISRTEFWRMIWQTGVSAGDWLYIDGGETYLASNLARPIILNQTLSIDLSKSWNTSSVTPNTIEKPAGYATLRRPSLWYDSTSNNIYSFGGEPYDVGSELSMWALSPNGYGGGTWTEKLSPTNNVFTTLTRPAQNLDTSSSTKGYILGGVATRRTSPQMTFGTEMIRFSLSGLTVFTFEDQSWKNISTSGYSQSGWGANGAAHFVSSFGEEGILVFIGGDASPTRSYVVGNSPKSMDEITIFDISNQKWYHQTATGDIPDSRVKFCMSGAQESETGLYELFVFGGMGSKFGSLNVDSHQVYIFTLPAFRWIRATNSSTASRAAHHCLVIGNRHMLSIGGYDPTALNESAVVDPWPYGLGIFDMTNLQWTDKYDATAMPYVQSSQVKSYYSKGSRYPSSWSDSLLELIFTNSTNSSTTAPKPGVQTDEAPRTGGRTDQANNHLHVGVILGSVFGVVGGLAVIVAVLLWFKRRNNTNMAPRPIDERNNTMQLSDAITYVMRPELAVTTPTRLNDASTYEIKPELAVSTPARLNGELPYGIKPELAVTTAAGPESCSNVEGNLNPPQPQMLDSDARQPLLGRESSRPANEIIELEGSFNKQ